MELTKKSILVGFFLYRSIRGELETIRSNRPMIDLSTSRFGTPPIDLFAKLPKTKIP